jgi:hypothetical protein
MRLRCHSSPTPSSTAPCQGVALHQRCQQSALLHQSAHHPRTYLSVTRALMVHVRTVGTSRSGSCMPAAAVISSLHTATVKSATDCMGG